MLCALKGPTRVWLVVKIFAFGDFANFVSLLDHPTVRRSIKNDPSKNDFFFRVRD